MTSSFTTPIKIGKKFIGDGHPIYIMADLGLTNGGDIKRTFQLIDILAEIGVDAVKFQMIGPETLLGDKTAEHTYPTLKNGPKTENMLSMFQKLSYTDDQWKSIKKHADEKGLEFICTSHHMGAVPLLEEMGVNVHKICTWSMTHKRLIQLIGKTGKALIMDTGAFTTKTLNDTLDWHQQAGGQGAIILHDFHTDDVSEMNFRAIPYLKNQFGYPVGYTPQGRDQDMDFMSIGLGANILEKRITLDRSIPENGHIKALDVEEFKAWFKRVKELEKAMGTAAVMPTKTDLLQSKKYFKSIYTKVDVKEGQLITDEMLEARRPGDGIPANLIDEVIGRYASADIKKETKISWMNLK